MDPAALDVGKRRILASHLKESIDVLELKVGQRDVRSPHSTHIF